MSGYTAKWSVDLIEELLDSGCFNKAKNRGAVFQAINDLNTHFTHSNATELRYNCLKQKLEEILNNKE